MIRTELLAGVFTLATTAGLVAPGPLVAQTTEDSPRPAFVVQVEPNNGAAGPGRLNVIEGLPAYFIVRPAGVADDPTAPARLQLAELAVGSIAEADRIGRPIPVEAQLRWSRRLLNAELAAATSRADQVRAAEAHVARVDRLVAAEAERTLAELTGPAAPGGPVRGITAESGPAWDERWAEVNRLGTAAVQLHRWLEVARRREPPDQAVSSGSATELNCKPDWPDWPRVITEPADEPRQRAILARLEGRVAFDFAKPVTLRDFLKFVARATVDPAGGLPEGIPIHPAPGALRDADETLDSTVTLRLDGVPLRTSLRLALGQLGLSYEVAGGLLVLTTEEEDENRLGPRRGAAVLRDQPGDDRLNAAIRAGLEGVVPMRFPGEVALGDLVEHVRRSTVNPGAGLPAGLPIYVDPEALADRDKSMASKLRIDLAGLPLRTTLRLALDQFHLTYVIEGGALHVVTIGGARDAQGVRGYAPAIPPNAVLVPPGTVPGLGGGFR